MEAQLQEVSGRVGHQGPCTGAPHAPALSRWGVEFGPQAYHSPPRAGLEAAAPDPIKR